MREFIFSTIINFGNNIFWMWSFVIGFVSKSSAFAQFAPYIMYT